MKIFIGLFIAALSAIGVAAQDTPQQPMVPTLAAPSQAVKVVSELTRTTQTSSMKNAPFSAEEVNESVQTLADGNRIVHSSTGKIYRNSEGRTRREMHGGVGGGAGFSYTVTPNVSIVDPVVRQKYELDSTLKTAKIYEMGSGQGLLTTAAPRVPTDPRAAEELNAKLRATEGRDRIQVITGEGSATTVRPMAVTGIASAEVAAVYAAAAKSKYETKTEELGTRDFDGVSAEGTRKTTIIPADAIGNERPIEIVYERWYSKELGLTVYSKTTDPRSGEQTYKLTNIVRAEPDPSLFSVPTEYRKISSTPGVVYRTAPTRAVSTVKTTTPTPASSKGANGIKP